jgi:hypothetical protein
MSTSTNPAVRPAAPGGAISKKAVLAASIGNAMEWYDFSVYAFFASYIAANFFKQGDETTALLDTFLVFAVGFIARPPARSAPSCSASTATARAARPR